MSPRATATARVWAAPALLAASTAAGLLSGLVGDGVWDAVGWCALGLPVAVALWCLWPGRRGGRTAKHS